MVENRRRQIARCAWVVVLLQVFAPPPQVAVAGAPPPRSPHGEMTRACTECHSTRGWHEIHFDHAATGFDLQGRHGDLPCVACHRLDDFTAAHGACLSCHTDGHEGALDPECAGCHEPQDWRATGFDHEMTPFPLWGAHGATDCIQCHVNEVTWQFGPRPETCYDCHEGDFRRAPVVVHLDAGPDCETCHILDDWKGAHDPGWFEIRRGAHEVSCDRCHKGVPDYPSYTCVDCHEFSLEVDEHVGIPADDARCLECHPGDFDDD